MAYDPTIPALNNYIGDDIPKIMANFAELAGSRIVEMGSNSNGRYVRWENGLQVCFGEILNQNAGTVLALTLPAAFATIGYFFLATASSSGSDTRYLVVEKRSAGVRTTSGLNIEFFAVTGTQQSSYNRFIAIGVWK